MLPANHFYSLKEIPYQEKRIRKFFCLFLMTFCVALIMLPNPLFAQNYTGSPVTKDRLLRVIESKSVALPLIVKIIEESGVSFKITPAVENEFLAIKTNRQIIEAAKANFRAAETSAQTTGKLPMRSANTAAAQQTDNNEQYEQLYYQGLQTITQLRMSANPQQAYEKIQSMRNIGLQAIKLNASRPEAYKIVGSAALLSGNYAEAEKYGQAAIDRGGSLAFPVYHMSGTPHPEMLHIGSGFITVESDQKFFQYNSSEVLSIQPQNSYFTPNGAVAVFSIATFKNNSPVAWYFSPANTGSSQEAYLIMKLIQNNILK